jgi:hypothetical protein
VYAAKQVIQEKALKIFVDTAKILAVACARPQHSRTHSTSRSLFSSRKLKFVHVSREPRFRRVPTKHDLTSEVRLMPRFLLTRTRPGRIKLALVVALALLVAVAALAAKSSLTTVVAVSAAAAPNQPPTAAATPSIAPRLESEHITIRPTGFEPAEIARPAGRVLLFVNDRSGLDPLDLRLDVESIRRLFEVRMPRDTKGKHEWRQLVVLVPGH